MIQINIQMTIIKEWFTICACDIISASIHRLNFYIHPDFWSKFCILTASDVQFYLSDSSVPINWHNFLNKMVHVVVAYDHSYGARCTKPADGNIL